MRPIAMSFNSVYSQLFQIHQRHLNEEHEMLAFTQTVLALDWRCVFALLVMTPMVVEGVLG